MPLLPPLPTSRLVPSCTLPPAVMAPPVVRVLPVVTAPVLLMLMPVVPPLPTSWLVPRSRFCVAVWLPRLSARLAVVVVLRLPLASAVTTRVPVPLRPRRRVLPNTSSRVLLLLVPKPTCSLPLLSRYMRGPVSSLKSSPPTPSLLLAPVDSRVQVPPPLLVFFSSRRVPTLLLLSSRWVKALVEYTCKGAAGELVPTPRLPAPLMLRLLPPLAMVVAWLRVPPSCTWVPLRVRPLPAVVLSPVGAVAVLRLPLSSAVTMRVPVPLRLSRRTLLVPAVPATCRVAAGDRVPMPT